MILIVCVDDHNGMMFNHRRQSQDRVLRADMMELTGGKKLWVSEYTKKQFPAEDADKLEVDPEFLKKAGEDEFCFAEDADLSEIQNQVQEIYLYHWNREYPADVYFTLDLSGWSCVETKEFAGSSHEKITREHYTALCR